jgi:putative methylase
VLQNPPFGVQKRGVDRKFLEKALQIGRRVYSLHKTIRTANQTKPHSRTQTVSASFSPFLKRFIEAHEGEIKAVYLFPMKVPYMFQFHRKRVYQFPVNLYVIERENKRFIDYR